MIPNKTIWSELWNRAQREPLGLFLRFTDNASAKWRLHHARPNGLIGYTVTHLSDPDAILITGPEARPPQTADRRAALRMILDDVTYTVDDIIDPTTQPLD